MLRNRNPQISDKKHLDCLTEIRNDAKRNGHVMRLYLYAEKYNISGSLPLALKNLGIIKVREYRGRTAIYDWNFSTKLDWETVLMVRCEVSNIIKKSADNAKIAKTIASKPSKSSTNTSIPSVSDSESLNLLMCYDAVSGIKSMSKEEKMDAAINLSKKGKFVIK